MAVARVYECKGWTADQYDSLIKTVDSRHGYDGRIWPGNLFHWAAVTDDGILAVDVSESVEVADRLAQELLGPTVAELGLPRPTVTQHTVYGLLSR